MYNIIFSFKFDEDVHMNIIWSKEGKGINFVYF